MDSIDGVPFTEWPRFTDRTYFGVADLIRHGRLTGPGGHWQRELERAFRQYTGTSYALTFNGGTNAILAGLHALGVGPGDDVVVPAFTFSGTAMPVLMLGANVVFADIDPRSFNVTADTVDAALRRCTNPKAVIGVHMHGLALDLAGIDNVCRWWGVHFVEDACQAHDTRYAGSHVGTYGIFGAFSMNVSKAMPAGEGGLLISDSISLITKAERYRTFGETENDMQEDRPYYSYGVGGNYRLTELAALLGVKSLDALPGVQRQARFNGKLLTSILEDVPGITPPETFGRDHTYHKYRILLPVNTDIDRALRLLRERGVPAFRWQNTALPEQPVYKQDPTDTPNAVMLPKRSLVIFGERYPLCAQTQDAVVAVGNAIAEIAPQITGKESS